MTSTSPLTATCSTPSPRCTAGASRPIRSPSPTSCPGPVCSKPVGGLAKLISLQADTPATTNAARYARIVEEHALLRRLIAVAGEIAELGYSVPDDVAAAVDQAEALVFDVAERRVTDSLKPLQSLLVDTLDRLERLYDRGEAITGVPTGYIDLDERLFGLQPSTLDHRGRPAGRRQDGVRPGHGRPRGHGSAGPDPGLLSRNVTR